MIGTTRHLKTRVLAALMALFVIGAIAAPSASAAEDTWYNIPSHRGASGKAIMDNFYSGYSSGSAYGRVRLNPGGGCAKVQYAPYAIGATDGSWNNLGTICGSSTTTLYWSDNFFLSYNGFKFRICKGGTCGSVVHIRGS